MKTRYLYLWQSKNFIYYDCYKKIIKCPGTAKVNKNSKKFIITNFCNNEIRHLKLEYKEFINIMENNKYK